MPSQSQTRFCNCSCPSDEDCRVTIPIGLKKGPPSIYLEKPPNKMPDFGLKKFLSVTILLGVLSFPNLSYAQNYSKISTDSGIERALMRLEEVHSDTVLKSLMGDNSSHRPVKIMFYSLFLLSPQYEGAHALATSDNDGNMYILIDSKYQNEPPEAIASIIAHEITHQLPKTTMEEETLAWTNEALQWIKFKKLNPKLAQLDENKYRLVKRLNYLERLYVNGNNSNELIAEAVSNNRSYKMLALK